MKKLFLILTSLSTFSYSQTIPSCFPAVLSSTFAVGSSPRAITTADFNNDGRLDIATANTVANKTSILLANGSGGFLPAADYVVGGGPLSITSATLNGDGFMDLALANNGSDNISILMGSASGTFATKVDYNVGSAPCSITSGYFNTDNFVDLAVANQFSGNVSVLFGSASGTFAAAVNYTVGASPRSLYSADFNSDLIMDLAVANHGSNNVSVLLGSSSGTFSLAGTFAVNANPNSITSGDFNNDTKMDLAVTNIGPNNISVLMGNGDGTFMVQVVYVLPGLSNPTKIINADVNSDGFTDLILNIGAPQYTSVMLGSISGTFSPIVNYAALGATPSAVTSADFNGDGKIDLGVTYSFSDNVSIMLNGIPTITLTTPGPICAGTATTIIASGASTYSVNSVGTASVISVSPISNTNYTVTGTINGCINRAVRTVTVNIPMPLVISPINPIICQTSSLNMTVTPGGTYTLIPSGATGDLFFVSPFATTIYTIESVDFNGCNNSKGYTVTVNPTPTITVNSGGVCAGNSFTITPSGANTYTISGGLSTVNPTITTSYSVTGTSAAGCVSNSNAISTVTVNSTPTITVNSGGVCTGNSFTITPSGANTYTITGGLSTVNPTITTSYSVTGTSAAGCVSNSNAISTVTINPTPTISVNSGGICTGNSFTIVPSGANTYTISGGSANVGPGSYSVNGTNILTGCVSSNAAISTVTLNPSPTLIISPSSTSLCAFTNATLTASGANTFTWSTGSNNVTTIVTPSVTASYTATGTTALGCVGTQTISLLVANSTNVTGNVTNGASVPVAGFVTLYRFEPMFTKFDSVSTINISGTGAFTFTNAINSNTYIIKATPTSNTLLVTYGNSSVAWMSATQFVHGCANTSTANVNVISLTPVVAGVGSLSGLIEKGPGYGQRSSDSRPLGTPIKGIIVKGGRNPGGNIIAQTTTDANGTYTLSGLPTNSDNYFILVDMPGLDTNGTYRKTLTAGNASFSNLNFTVDSAKINPTNVTVGINELTLTENNISVFPNPSSSNVSVNFTLLKTSAVKIEMFDILGKQVKTLIDSKTIPVNSYNTTATIEDLDAGIYFIKIAINNKEQIIKLCVQR